MGVEVSAWEQGEYYGAQMLIRFALHKLDLV